MRLHGVEQKTDRQDADADDDRRGKQRQRLGEWPQPQGRQEVLAAEHAAEGGTESDCGKAARHQDGKERPTAPEDEAGDEDDEALADIAEHEAEKDRRDERKNEARIALVLRERTAHPRENFKAACKARIAEEKRRIAARGCRRDFQVIACAHGIERGAQPLAVGVARPAGHEDEAVACAQLADMFVQPFDQGDGGEDAGSSCCCDRCAKSLFAVTRLCRRSARRKAIVCALSVPTGTDAGNGTMRPFKPGSMARTSPISACGPRSRT